VKNLNRRRALSFAAVIGATTLASVVWACYGELVDSVHFYGPNRWMKPIKVDFGRVPQAIMPPNSNDELRRGGTAYGASSEDQKQQRKYNRARARNFEVQGEFRRALRAYELSDAEPALVQERRELFNALGFRNVAGLQGYLRVRYQGIYRQELSRQHLLNSLLGSTVDSRLTPFIDYFAVEVKSSVAGPALARRYWQYAQKYNESPRAESAMIMAIRMMLTELRDENPTAGQLAEARGWIERLLARYPKTRFRFNALGWLGRIELLSNRTGKALDCYLRQARDASSENERWHAYDSIFTLCAKAGRTDKAVLWLLRQRSLNASPALQVQSASVLQAAFPALKPRESQFVQRELRQDPILLYTYIAFRIEFTRLSPAQEQNLLAFCESSLAKLRDVPGKLLSRLAQLNYNVARYASCARLASRAINSLPSRSEERLRARYALAASYARQGLYQKSIREYRSLIRANPPTYLKQSAQESLALLEERHGDIVKAAILYQDLRYPFDLAYLVDAKMTPEQLSRLIGVGHFTDEAQVERFAPFSRRATPSKKVLIYTLGLRLLRQERYSEARRCFLRLSKHDRLNSGMLEANRKELVSDGSIGDEEAPKRVDPIQVVNELEELTRKSLQGTTPEARAQAIYTKAAYIYHRRNLMFYSMGLWQGDRSMILGIFWSKSVNDQSDERALAKHLAEHECLAHSLRLCDELVKKYPHAKVVPEALYTAALAASRLSNFNTIWRDRGPLLLKIAINRLDRLTREFPDHKLTKAARKYKGVFVADLQNALYWQKEDGR